MALKIGSVVAGLALAVALSGTVSAAPCDAAIAFSSARQGVELLVLKNGQPVCEHYANGGAPDKGYEIWSGTKSFAGIMAAAAVQDGLLTLDEPVARTITEWRSDPQKSKMTIRQLLSLTGGQGGPVGQAPTYSAAIAVPLTAEPGAQFQYGPTPFQVFGAIMKRKLATAGMQPDVLAYLKTRVLDPIGARPTNWRLTVEGDPILPQGSVWSARGWARYGEFIRAGGKVGGKPIVDPATFAELFKGSAINPAYGVSWWLPRATAAADVVTASLDLGPHEAEMPADLVIAAGAGNQRLYVIPSLGLTMVRLADFDPAAIMAARAARAAGSANPATKWSDYAFLKLLMADPALK